MEVKLCYEFNLQNHEFFTHIYQFYPCFKFICLQKVSNWLYCPPNVQYCSFPPNTPLYCRAGTIHLSKSWWEPPLCSTRRHFKNSSTCKFHISPVQSLFCSCSVFTICSAHMSPSTCCLCGNHYTFFTTRKRSAEVSCKDDVLREQNIVLYEYVSFENSLCCT